MGHDRRGAASPGDTFMRVEGLSKGYQEGNRTWVVLDNVYAAIGRGVAGRALPGVAYQPDGHGGRHSL